MKGKCNRSYHWRAGGGRRGQGRMNLPPLPLRLPPLRRSSYCMQVNLHTCVYTYGYAHWGGGAAAGTASSPLRVLRAVMFHGSPGLLHWRCCYGGGFPLQYVHACVMKHSFLTLDFIPYIDVYITNGVYIFIRKILWSCTVVFLLMNVLFPMYLVRDDLINNWNHSIFIVWQSSIFWWCVIKRSTIKSFPASCPDVYVSAV